MKKSMISVVGLAAALVISASSAFAAQDLLFSLGTSGLSGAQGDNITAIGSFLASTSNATLAGTNPKIEVVNGAKWSKNSIYTAPAPSTTIHGTGYKLAAGPGDISITNGFSLVTAVRPEDFTAGTNFRTILNIYGNQIQLAMMDSGDLKVRRFLGMSGTTVLNDTQTGPKLVAGTATVLSMVINNDGSFNLWSTASGPAAVLSGGALSAWTGGTVTSLIKGTTTALAGIGFGSNVTQGSSSWRGLVGDTYVYKSALTDAERLQLVSDVQTSMHLGSVPEPSSILALLMGLGSVAGLARRKK